MDDARFLRTTGLWCIVGGSVNCISAIVAGLFPPAVSPEMVSAPFTPTVFSLFQVLLAIAALLMTIGTFGFTRSGATGDSLLGRIGGWMALVGMVGTVPGNLAFVFFANERLDSPAGNALGAAIGLATVVAALGFVLAGIATVRAGRWHGWQRFIPLANGAIIFVLLLPVMGVQPTLFVWPLALWSLTFVLLGLTLRQQGGGEERRAMSAATA